jgi:hypothetical protein
MWFIYAQMALGVILVAGLSLAVAVRPASSLERKNFSA